jgi:hypothetical protein
MSDTGYIPSRSLRSRSTGGRSPWKGYKEQEVSNLEGAVIPVVYGWVIVLGKIILFDQADGISNTTEAADISRYKMYINVNYSYKTSIWFAICMGKIDINDVYANKRHLNLNTDWSTSRFNDGTGIYYPPVNPITYPLVEKIPGIAHIYFSSIYNQHVILNDDTTVPKMEFGVMRDQTESAVIVNQALYLNEGLLGNTYVGSNPALVIYDLLTNKQYGLGIDPSYIDVTSFNYVAALFDSPEYKSYKRIYGLNFAIEDMTPAVEIFDRIRDQTDVQVYCENNKIYLHTLYDLHAEPVATLYDDDFSSLEIYTEGWENVPNEFEGEYTARGEDADVNVKFQNIQISIKNEAAIKMAGGYVNKRTVDLEWFSHKTIAAVRLNEIMQRESFPKISLQCSVSRRHYHIRPFDLINVISLEYSLVGTFRVLSVKFGGVDSLDVVIEAEQAFETLWDGTHVNRNSSNGVVPVADWSPL